jgi:hypothetical protein
MYRSLPRRHGGAILPLSAIDYRIAAKNSGLPYPGKFGL